jgi:hypothetical protein
MEKIDSSEMLVTHLKTIWHERPGDYNSHFHRRKSLRPYIKLHWNNAPFIAIRLNIYCTEKFGAFRYFNEIYIMFSIHVSFYELWGKSDKVKFKFHANQKLYLNANEIKFGKCLLPRSSESCLPVCNLNATVKIYKNCNITCHGRYVKCIQNFG